MRHRTTTAHGDGGRSDTCRERAGAAIGGVGAHRSRDSASPRRRVAVVRDEQLLERRLARRHVLDAGVGQRAQQRLHRAGHVALDRRGRRRRRCSRRRARESRAPAPSSSARTWSAARPRSTSRRPVSMIRPARSIATRSHTASTSLRMCDDSNTVCPRSRASRDARAEHLLHERVEPGRRLVEQQEIGPARERGDQQDLLPVAVAVRADLLVGRRARTGRRARRGRRRRPSRGRAEEPQRLGAGERRPEVRLARHVREPAVDRRARRATRRDRRSAPRPRSAGSGRAAARSSSTCRRRSARDSRTPRPASISRSSASSAVVCPYRFVSFSALIVAAIAPSTRRFSTKRARRRTGRPGSGASCRYRSPHREGSSRCRSRACRSSRSPA